MFKKQKKSVMMELSNSSADQLKLKEQKNQQITCGKIWPTVKKDRQ
jgi:hypothetical protein